MMNWLLNFASGIVFISLALIGFALITLILMQSLWGKTVDGTGALSAEDQIERLRDDTVGAMFDLARSERTPRTETADSDD